MTARSRSDTAHRSAELSPGARYGPITRGMRQPCPNETATSPASLCWIDTSHPDPKSVLLFYSGLFGWVFEDVMPEESEGEYYVGRIRGGDAAAIGSIPPGAPPYAAWNSYIWVDSADETAAAKPATPVAAC